MSAKSYEDFKNDPEFLREFIELLKQEHAAEIKALEEQWEPEWKSQAEANAAGYNQAHAKIVNLEATLKLAAAAIGSGILELEASYDDLGTDEEDREVLDRMKEVLKSIKSM